MVSDADLEASPATRAAVAGCRAVTRSASPHPGAWGHAIALALEYLAVQIAYTTRQPEPGILLGYDVCLHLEPNGEGVIIQASVADSPASTT